MINVLYFINPCPGEPGFILFIFENIVDPDQQASEEPADQDLHCFPL